MPKLSVGQKAQRAIKFLTGLDNPRIASALYHYGFRDADRVQGYALLQRLTDDRLDELPSPPPDRRKVVQLDAWENEWFPVIHASTRFRFPEIHERLFRNLAQTQGPEVVIAVGTLIRRLDELSASEEAEDQSAVALLQSRGVTEPVLGRARALLDANGTAPKAVPLPVMDEAERQAREDALWEWYLEWSTIARTAITNKRLLRQIGFLGNSRRGSGGVDDVEDFDLDPGDSVEAPAPDEAADADADAAE